MKRFRIVGTRYSDKKSYEADDLNQEFPYYKEIETVDLGEMEFEGLYSAALWLVNNHPALFFGSEISSVDSVDGCPRLTFDDKSFYLHEYFGEEVTTEEAISRMTKYLERLSKQEGEVGMKRYQIVGMRFSDEKSYYSWDTNHRYPRYEILGSEDLGIHEFESLDHAALWLAMNHPDLYFGSSIFTVDRRNFLINAVKEYYLNDCSYETTEQAIASEIARLEKNISQRLLQ